MLLLLACLTVEAGTFAAQATEPATPVASVTLHNLFRLDEGLYSGSAPESEAAFAELARLGVKTIISVDGAKPEVALARKHGLRYVHLPIGYDAVPRQRGVQLAKAAQLARADGAVYVHCHHAKHRGPAAAATVCRARDGWSAEKAEAFLKQAGTAPDYAGLWRDVRSFRPPTAEELARVPERLPESAPTTPLVDAMVAVDDHYDILIAAQKAGWQETPSEAATLTWELLREMARDPETKKRGDDYAEKLMDGIRTADALRAALRAPTLDAARRDAALAAVTKSCVACHKAHRD